MYWFSRIYSKGTWLNLMPRKGNLRSKIQEIIQLSINFKKILNNLWLALYKKKTTTISYEHYNFPLSSLTMGKTSVLVISWRLNGIVYLKYLHKGLVHAQCVIKADFLCICKLSSQSSAHLGFNKNMFGLHELKGPYLRE